jgi:hypothetical protein
MAIIWADFPSGQQGLYNTNTALMLNGIWAELVSVGLAPELVNDIDPAIGSSGRVLLTQAQGNSGADRPTGLRFAYPSPQTTMGVSFRLWQEELPSDNRLVPFVSFRNAANFTLFAIRFLSNGSIEVRRSDNELGVLLGTTTGPVVTANSYKHIEIKGFSSSSAGTIEIKVDGVSVLNLSSLNTGGGNIAQIVIGSLVSPNPPFPFLTKRSFWKDLIFWDTTTAQNNDFLGECIVRHLIPNGDVTLGSWTTSSGTTGFNLLAQSPPVDTNFIRAGIGGFTASQFNLTNLPPDIVTVKALLPITRSRKVDGGDGNLQTGLTGTLTDLGNNSSITTAFTYRWDVSELSPDTGAPWTPVQVDAVKLDIDRTV